MSGNSTNASETFTSDTNKAKIIPMTKTNVVGYGNGSIPDKPLMLFQPFNVVVFLSFYSPVIIAILVTSMSFLFQNFKGFIYLGYLIGVSIIRNYAYKWSSKRNKNEKPQMNDGTICTSVQYTKYGNSSFSYFVFAFTAMYLLYPMFVNGSINFWLLSGIITYFFIDVFVKVTKKCNPSTLSTFLNLLAGVGSALIIIVLMYAGGSSQYLFFNETQNNKEVCTMPSNQTFKCSVYKNGELIGAI
jgi:hypothetical protein